MVCANHAWQRGDTIMKLNVVSDSAWGETNGVDWSHRKGLLSAVKRKSSFRIRQYPKPQVETGSSSAQICSSTGPSFSVLLVGDEAGCANRVWSSLESIQLDAKLSRRWVTRIKDIQDIIRHLSVDLIFCDLPGEGEGFERLDCIRRFGRDIPLVVLIGRDGPEIQQRLRELGVEDQLGRSSITSASVRRIVGRVMERQVYREQVESIRRRERLRGEILARIADNAPLSDVLTELNQALRKEMSCENCSLALELRDSSGDLLPWADESNDGHAGVNHSPAIAHRDCKACLKAIRYGSRMLGDLSMVPDSNESAEDTLHAYAKLGAELAALAIDRLRTNDSLRQSQEELRTLSAQLMNIQETERQRIAGDLHDVIGQSLSVVKVSIEEAEQQLIHSGSPEVAEVLSRLVPWVKTALGEVRRISMDLRPATIDDLGILPTLSWFFREFVASCRNLTIEPVITLSESDVPERLKIVIFRILQEAISNIVKHAQAKRIQVILQRTEAGLELAVIDDGRGFDTSINDHKAGLGLTSMRERARISGGHYSLESAPGTGVRIRVNWPLAASVMDLLPVEPDSNQ